MKNIATSISDFEKLIDLNSIYVDKTDYLFDLISKAPGMFFCSRPRRFGKTLTLYTLEAIFKGKKNLFKGLKIFEKNYDWKKHPVVHLDFGIINAIDAQSLEVQLNECVYSIANSYGIKIEYSKFCNINLRRLILGLGKNKDVVILVDEYDKPLTSNIFNPEIERIRGVLRGFFEVIKASTDYIHFAFITGVTKFAKMSVFSSMNNLTDITMDESFSYLFGYTQDEVELYFSDYIDKGVKTTGLSLSKYLEKLKNKYDGYSFSPYQKETIYNPVSIGEFFLKGGKSFENYWSETGGMKFLMDIAKKVDFDISQDVARVINRNSITSFDILEVASTDVSLSEYRSLLFQTGYLTIKKVDEDDENLLYLDFPNEEVAETYSIQILQQYAGKKAISVFGESKIAKFFADGETERAMELLSSIYASIPYNLSVRADEFFYSSIFFAVLKALGAEIGSEIETNKGRIDAILNTERHVYVIEFKYDKSAEIALDQIYSTGYSEQFISQRDKVIHLLGINFSKEEKNIKDWKEALL